MVGVAAVVEVAAVVDEHAVVGVAAVVDEHAVVDSSRMGVERSYQTRRIPNTLHARSSD